MGRGVAVDYGDSRRVAVSGWVTHTIRVTDANFANTWGWDFAINAAGNRSEDLIVRTVSVRKGAP